MVLIMVLPYFARDLNVVITEQAVELSNPNFIY